MPVTYRITTDPNARARGAIQIAHSCGRPWVRDTIPGHHYLTGFDSVGCYVFVPCDREGRALPEDPDRGL